MNIEVHTWMINKISDIEERKEYLILINEKYTASIIGRQLLEMNNDGITITFKPTVVL